MVEFLLDGKLKTHKLYQKIIEEQKKILEENPNQIGYENIVQAFLIERNKRKGTPEYYNFYCNQQFYHFLADLFGAGLDTTLTTLRLAVFRFAFVFLV